MVFLAEDPLLKRRVAIKRLHPHLLNSTEAVARFKKEALAVAALSHENIVRLLDAGEMEGRLFLAMEYVEGYSLDEVLRRHPGPLPNLVSLEILRQLLAGLASAHKHSIIHRDVKPSNVLVDLDGGVRLTDFGLANLTGDGSLTLTGALIGTPQYMAPEQALGKEASAKSDVFGAGLVLYRCLTGKQAFAGRNPQELLVAASRARFAAPFTLNAKALPCLTPLLQKLLAKGPEMRPDAAACLEIMDRICREEGLAPEKKGLARFLIDAEAAQVAENLELRDLYVGKAESLLDRGKTAPALRALSTAELFGSIPGSKDKFRSLRVRVRGMRRLYAAAGTVIALAFTTWIWNSLDTEEYLAPATPPSLTPIPFVPDPAPVALKTAATQAPGEKMREIRRSEFPRVHEKETKRIQLPAKMRAAEATANSPSAFLLVKSSPPFAEVIIDGVPAGLTPMRQARSLMPGLHRINLRRELWLPFDTSVELESGSLEIRLEMAREKTPDPVN